MSVAETYDVIVLGVGGMGGSALYHLAKTGARVCGIEQFPISHDRGSSHGDSRVIRKAYFLHPDYVPLLHRAYDLWRELESESGKSLMTLTGLLCAGPPDGPLIKGLDVCYATHDLPHERWTAAQAREHYPQFALPDNCSTYFDPLGGFLRVEECVATHAALAQRHGATIHADEPVLSWEADASGVTVTTARRRIEAGTLILTAGAWVAKELASLGLPLTVKRKALFWYQVNDAPGFEPGPFPIWIYEDGEREFYGFPVINANGLKAAEDSGGQVITDPSTVNRDLVPEDETGLRDCLDHLFPGAVGTRVRHKTCLYTMTPDHHFVLDRHPTHSNVLISSCCSGHGFKFASVIGEILSELALTGKTRQPIALFNIDRLGR